MDISLMEELSYTKSALEDTTEEIHQYVSEFLKERSIYDINSKDIFFLYKIFIYYGGKGTILSTDVKKFSKSKNMSYNIKKLIKNNYLEKNSYEGDIRCYFIKLTEKTEILLKNFNNSLKVDIDKFSDFNENIKKFNKELANFRCKFIEITSIKK